MKILGKKLANITRVSQKSHAKKFPKYKYQSNSNLKPSYQKFWNYQGGWDFQKATWVYHSSFQFLSLPSNKRYYSFDFFPDQSTWGTITEAIKPVTSFFRETTAGSSFFRDLTVIIGSAIALKKYVQIKNAEKQALSSKLSMAVIDKNKEEIKKLLENKTQINEADLRGNIPLHYAVRGGGDLLITKWLLDSGSSIEKQNNIGMTPFYEACESGSLDVVKLLIAKMANINKSKSYFTFSRKDTLLKLLKIKAKDNWTPLMGAVWNDNFDVATFLIANADNEMINADASYPALSKQQNVKYDSPIYWAIKNGNKKLTELLIEHGADIEALYYDRTGNVTLLNLAISLAGNSLHHNSILEFLLKYYKKLEKTGFLNVRSGLYGFTSLHEAVNKDNLKLIKQLVEEFNVDIEKFSSQERMPIEHSQSTSVRVFLLCRMANNCKINGYKEKDIESDKNKILRDISSQEKIIEAVIEKVLPNQKDEKILRTFKLRYAISFGLENLVKELIVERSLDVDSSHKHCGRTLFYDSVFSGSLELVKLIVNKLEKNKVGNFINEPSNIGWTPLIAAAWRNNFKMVKHILELSKEYEIAIDINKVNSDGKSAIYYAVENANFNLTKLLLANGAKVMLEKKNQFTPNVTPLHIAAIANNTKILQLLLENLDEQKDIDVRSGRHERTPLHEAAREGCLEAIQLLLKYNANPDLRTHHGWVANELTKNLVIKELLLGHYKKHEQTKDSMLNIIYACQTNNIRLFAKIIESNPIISINLSDSYWNTALHYACKNGNLSMIKYLLTWKADPLAKNKINATCIYEACMYGHYKALNLFPDDVIKTALEITTKQGWTLLNAAVYHNHYLVAKKLIHFGADINHISIDGENAITRAIKNDNIEILGLLINHKNFMDKFEQLNPLHVAATIGSHKCLELLINSLKKKQPFQLYSEYLNTTHVYGRTVLHQATVDGHIEMVIKLLEEKINLLAKTKDGHTALDLISSIYQSNEETKYKEIKQLLISKSRMSANKLDDPSIDEMKKIMSVNESDDPKVIEMKKIMYLIRMDPDTKQADVQQGNLINYGIEYFNEICDAFENTTLHEFTRHAYQAILPKVLDSLESAKKVDNVDKFKNSRGMTLLYKAVFHGSIDSVKYLIKKGADVNVKKSGEWTPLILAAWSGNAEILELLLKAGAEPNECLEDGMTALHWAVDTECKDVVKILVDHPGIDLNVQNNFGIAPLHIAAKNGSLEIVKMLTEKGANVEISAGPMKLNMRPLHYAAKNYKVDVLNYLIGQGVNIFAKISDAKMAIDLLEKNSNRPQKEEAEKILLQEMKEADLNVAMSIDNTQPTETVSPSFKS